MDPSNLSKSIELDREVRTSSLDFCKLNIETDAGINPYEVDLDPSSLPCLHQRFELQALRAPTRIALTAESGSLSYEQLNARSSQMAAYLQSRGMNPGSVIATYMERSPETIVCLLAILKAGCAYLPLEIGLPADRLAFMLQDAQVTLLIVQNEPPDAAADLAEDQLFRLDSDWISSGNRCPTPTKTPTSGDQLAYIMYTSGSTGLPKGVCIPHRGVVRLVQQTDYVDLRSGQIFLQYAPLSFDASTFEIWGALLNGSTLVIPTPGPLSLTELGKTIQRFQVTTLWLTAGLFHLMVDERLDDCRSVRQLVAGGDVLSVSHARKFLETWPDCKLINGYGPTENTTFSCTYLVEDPEHLQGSIPIGKPIAHSTAYVLDSDMTPVAEGETGELYVGGDGVALGYLNRPELTAERFIPDPFDPNPGRLLFKTGDRVRSRTDGHLEFLGRVDLQVKIRGYRVELPEVERLVGQHPAVQQVVALAVGDLDGAKRLIAYVKLVPDAPNSLPDIRTFLQDQVPEYLIPSGFVVVKAFPLTLNGKVDRKALPDPTRQRPPLSQPYLAPQTDIQKRLAALWADLLQLDRVGIRDHFFDLGGTSFLSLRLVETLRHQFDVTLPVVKVYQHPTIERLAGELTPQSDRSPQMDPIHHRAQLQRAALSQRQKPHRGELS